MATRNRTQAFLKYRDALHQARPVSHATTFGQADHVAIDVRSGGGTKGGYVQLTRQDPYFTDGVSSSSTHQPSSTTNLPPVWVDISEKVKEDMALIKTKMVELSKVQGRALLPSFDDDGKVKPHEQKMEVLTHEITQALKACERRIQRLPVEGGSEASMSICRNVQRSIATDLQALSMDFRKQSKQYLQKLQQQQIKGGSRSTRFEQPSTSNRTDDGYDQGFDERQMLRAARNDSMTAEREQEINEIVQSVGDLAQIMKDLSVLVIDQGTIVDRIDYNIQTVSERVEKGVKELVKADNTQKKTAMIQCILVLLAVCLALFVLLVLKKLIF